MTGAASNSVFAADLIRTVSGSTVEIRKSSTVNAYGERTYVGTAVTYPAHVQRVTVNPPGFDDTVTVEYQIQIPSTDLTIDTTAEVKLPSPISATREILKVEEHHDASGRCGLTVFVGSRTD